MRAKMRMVLPLTMVALLGASPAPATPKPTTKGRPMTTTLHDFTVRDGRGNDVTLSRWKGKVVLVVNTASRCGFTPQYKGLEALADRYRARGFEVLAFPANDFLGQEPGTDAEIAEFCALNYQTSFPLFSKSSVKGRHISPLYHWLTKDSGFPGDIEWNFAKFLIGPEGRVVARFSPRTDPLSRDVTDAIEALLAAKR